MYKINIIEPIYLAINKCIAILNERVFDNKLKNLVFLIQSEKATKKILMALSAKIFEKLITMIIVKYHYQQKTYNWKIQMNS